MTATRQALAESTPSPSSGAEPIKPEKLATVESGPWKAGNEFAPYHPSASHVEPGYRDGWNACWRAMLAAEAKAFGAAYWVLIELPDGRLVRIKGSDLKPGDMVVFDGPDAFPPLALPGEG